MFVQEHIYTQFMASQKGNPTAANMPFPYSRFFVSPGSSLQTAVPAPSAMPSKVPKPASASAPPPAPGLNQSLCAASPVALAPPMPLSSPIPPRASPSVPSLRTATARARPGVHAPMNAAQCKANSASNGAPVLPSTSTPRAATALTKHACTPTSARLPIPPPKPASAPKRKRVTKKVRSTPAVAQPPPMSKPASCDLQAPIRKMRIAALSASSKPKTSATVSLAKRALPAREKPPSASVSAKQSLAPPLAISAAPTSARQHAPVAAAASKPKRVLMASAASTPNRISMAPAAPEPTPAQTTLATSAMTAAVQQAPMPAATLPPPIAVRPAPVTTVAKPATPPSAPPAMSVVDARPTPTTAAASKPAEPPTDQRSLKRAHPRPTTQPIVHASAASVEKVAKRRRIISGPDSSRPAQSVDASESIPNVISEQEGEINTAGAGSSRNSSNKGHVSAEKKTSAFKPPDLLQTSLEKYGCIIVSRNKRTNRPEFVACKLCAVFGSDTSRDPDFVKLFNMPCEPRIFRSHVKREHEEHWGKLKDLSPEGRIDYFKGKKLPPFEFFKTKVDRYRRYLTSMRRMPIWENGKPKKKD